MVSSSGLQAPRPQGPGAPVSERTFGGLHRSSATGGVKSLCRKFRAPSQSAITRVCNHARGCPRTCEITSPRPNHDNHQKSVASRREHPGPASPTRTLRNIQTSIRTAALEAACRHTPKVPEVARFAGQSRYGGPARRAETGLRVKCRRGIRSRSFAPARRASAPRRQPGGRLRIASARSKRGRRGVRRRVPFGRV